MRVIRIREGLFKDTVVLKADKFEECYMGTLIGTRNYWVNKGTKVQIKLPKSWCVEVDDEYALEDLVIHLGGLSDKFDWQWS